MNLSVRDGVVGTASCENQHIARRLFVDMLEDMEKRFLVHRLNGSRDVAVSRFQRLIGTAGWTKQILQLPAVELAYGRRLIHPLVRGFAGMMFEITEVQ